MRILLMGNPNVGKSVVFSRLTGIRVVASNYPGTTVGFTEGSMKLGGEEVEVLDAPGTYSLEPTNKAEEVAEQLLQTGDLVINVVNATNLERNLYLTLQLIERQIPVIVELNMWDEARHKGVKIDVKKLEAALGVPVVPTVALSGEGIAELVNRVPEATSLAIPTRTPDERWSEMGRIVAEVQEVTHHHHTWLERLEDASLKPFPGLLLAALVLAGSFYVIRLIGEGLIGYVTEPFFYNIYAPLLMKLSALLGSGGFWHNVLVGRLINGEIDFGQSFGVLTTGLFIPLGAVLPYILSFYLVLSFLEDLGYLPRLAVLLDNVMHRLGMHGFAIIPTFLALGCNVPGILATRILESKRERFIAITLMSIAVPCAALQAMIIGLVGDYGLHYVLLIYGVLFLVWASLGFILNLAVKGFRPELLIEIPPYRIPMWRALFTKLWLRVFGFLREAVPIIIIAALAISILDYIGIFDFIARLASPVVSGLWGLPKEATAAMVVGFLRKDLAVGMLAPLNLNIGQLVVGCSVLAMFFPCIASFLILARELGLRDLLKAAAVMLSVAVLVGWLLNMVV